MKAVETQPAHFPLHRVSMAASGNLRMKICCTITTTSFLSCFKIIAALNLQSPCQPSLSSFRRICLLVCSAVADKLVWFWLEGDERGTSLDRI